MLSVCMLGGTLIIVRTHFAEASMNNALVWGVVFMLANVLGGAAFFKQLYQPNK